MEVNSASVADAVARLANYEATFKFERISLSQSGAAVEVVTGTGTSLRFGEFVRSETRVNISRNGGEPIPARTVTIIGEDGLTLWSDSIGVPGAIGFRQVSSDAADFRDEMKGARSTGNLVDPLDRVTGAWWGSFSSLFQPSRLAGRKQSTEFAPDSGIASTTLESKTHPESRVVFEWLSESLHLPTQVIASDPTGVVVDQLSAEYFEVAGLGVFPKRIVATTTHSCDDDGQHCARIVETIEVLAVDPAPAITPNTFVWQ
ncbi:MAG: hypothetical protein SF028_05455 [Candidatus Sumerlaeia bacterium]|nr:hypothetical protein [Candidatus Sumerlaeia bacterium]